MKMNRLLAFSPNLKQSWMLCAILVLCQTAGAAASFIINSVAPEWSDFAGYVLSFILVALVVVRSGKGSHYEPVAAPRQSPLLWLLLVPFTLLFVHAVEPLAMWVPTPEPMKQLYMDFFRINLPSFLLLVFIAPVCEEWLFRGIILKGLLKRRSPLKAIVWSAVIFGVIHIIPMQMISAFFLGLMIGWIYWHTRSLFHCIFIHAVNNAAAFISSIFFPDTTVDASIFNTAGGYYMYAGAHVIWKF